MMTNIEGYPVMISKLLPADLRVLQKIYLPQVLEDTAANTVVNGTGAVNQVSNHESQRWNNPELFTKWNKVISEAPYIQTYLDSFFFQFPYNVEVDTWYNVYKKNDHQQLHDHLTTNVPAFSCVVVLKQPNQQAGQLNFRAPSLSNHLKYLELDPQNQFPNVFKPTMEDGSVIIFPSCLEHFVSYNQTDEQRVIFSSNVTITREDKLYGTE
jgi:ectoine hydroxylase-related dioxygenase (phytanoyl-CoA dioxygenase family)